MVATRFDPNAYDYSVGEAALDALSALLFGAGDSHLRGARLAGGGKNVSLVVSDAIAPLHPKLRVPKYFPIPKGDADAAAAAFEAWLEANSDIERVIFRSSDDKEDWIDPRCGVKTSAHYAREMTLSDRLRAHLAAGEQVVAQEHFYGVGYVIDVAWSALLGRAVFHVAAGHWYVRGGAMTSATNDLEAAHVIYDLDTGEQLVPVEDGYTSIDEGMSMLAAELRPVLTNAPLPFGFQLEIIIHPKQPDVWHLVQCRPSPDRLRGMCEAPAIEGKPLLQSARPSRMFDISGELVVLSRGPMRRDDPLVEACEATSEFEVKPEHVGKLAGKIVLWEELPSLEYTRRFQMVVGAASMGAVAQMMEGACLTNSNHDGYEKLRYYRVPRLEAASRTCAFLGLPYRAVIDAFGWGEKSGRFRLVSDGLVAAVYQIGS